MPVALRYSSISDRVSVQYWPTADQKLSLSGALKMTTFHSDLLAEEVGRNFNAYWLGSVKVSNKDWWHLLLMKWVWVMEGIQTGETYLMQLKVRKQLHLRWEGGFKKTEGPTTILYQQSWFVANVRQGRWVQISVIWCHRVIERNIRTWGLLLLISIFQ